MVLIHVVGLMVVCAAGDPVLPPDPVYRDGWSISGEIQQANKSSECRADLRGLRQPGPLTVLTPLWRTPTSPLPTCLCVCVQVQAADSVLVIGGGSTGVEMAAEIKTEYPDKKVRCCRGNP